MEKLLDAIQTLDVQKITNVFKVLDTQDQILLGVGILFTQILCIYLCSCMRAKKTTTFSTTQSQFITEPMVTQQTIYRASKATNNLQAQVNTTTSSRSRIKKADDRTYSSAAGVRGKKTYFQNGSITDSEEAEFDFNDSLSSSQSNESSSDTLNVWNDSNVITDGDKVSPYVASEHRTYPFSSVDTRQKFLDFNAVLESETGYEHHQEVIEALRVPIVDTVIENSYIDFQIPDIDFNDLQCTFQLSKYQPVNKNLQSTIEKLDIEDEVLKEFLATELYATAGKTEQTSTANITNDEPLQLIKSTTVDFNCSNVPKEDEDMMEMDEHHFGVFDFQEYECWEEAMDDEAVKLMQAKIDEQHATLTQKLDNLETQRKYVHKLVKDTKKEYNGMMKTLNKPNRTQKLLEKRNQDMTFEKLRLLDVHFRGDV